jgi:hypothetical protein
MPQRLFDAPIPARLALGLLRSADKTDEPMHSDLVESICYNNKEN